MTYWNDNGLCKHGQIFDPKIKRCRDVFCMEGYTFTKDGCQPDPNYNSTNILNSVLPDDLEIELTLVNQLCNKQLINCSKSVLIASSDKLIEEFKISLSKQLNINKARIQNVTIIESYFTNDTSICSVMPQNGKQNKTEITLSMFLNKNTTAISEGVRLRFEIEDNKNYPDDEEETLALYYTLLKLSLDFYDIELFEKNMIICNVKEIKSSSQGWCTAPDSKKLYVDGFYILASFENSTKVQYYVYVNKTETFYKTGDFFLSIGYVPRMELFSTANNKSFFELSKMSDYNEFEDFQESKLRSNFLDVSNIILDGSQNAALVQSLLTVCNRYPRINTKCPDLETIRLKKCELTQLLNRTVCYMGTCYSTNEYEYDREKPEQYIRVCKFDKNKSNTSYGYIKSNEIISTIPGYISFVSTILSITAMIITLITYALFKELRNIPGWNCINLTISLTIAQLSFLTGSFVASIPILCLITALLTHYGLLAAFFWMNVIAFDLFRNFRKKSSHILIYMINLKSRLAKYALFAWGSPFILVLLCLLIDINVNNKNFILKPCYALYFKSCNQSSNFNYLYVNTEGNGTSLNETITIPSNFSEENKPCIAAGSQPDVNTVPQLVVNCWIHNGMANLFFFGAPIGIIIIINAFFYIITICTIRQKKRTQKTQRIRRFSRVKCPIDNDIKFYIRMAVIMGFTWVIGFFLTTFSSENEEFKIINQILIYIFILCNSSMGVFIFFAFIFKRQIKDLYMSLFKRKNNESKKLTETIQNPKHGPLARMIIYLKESFLSYSKDKIHQDTHEPDCSNTKL